MPSGRRVLIVVPPLTGHVNPTIALADELVARGHAVAWCGLPGVVDEMLPADAAFFAACTPEETARLGAMTERPDGLRGAAALKFLWQDVLFPLTDAMVEGVGDAVDRFAPDIVVADQQALAGAIVALRSSLHWVTSATTSGELADPLADLPLVENAIRSRMVDAAVTHGVDPTTAAATDLRFSPELVLAYTTEHLVGPGVQRDAVAFVGPSLSSAPSRDGFDWAWLHSDRPHVLVSLGTLNAQVGSRFWQVAVDACRDADFQAVFIAPEELVPNPPDNVRVQPRVPQVALLDEMDAVVSHGGHNTVCESLAAGVPLVVAPIRDDQPIIADQVVQADAGVRVRFNRVRAPELRAAIEKVLTDPDISAGAAAVAASFAAAGGPAAAVDLLEKL